MKWFLIAVVIAGAYLVSMLASFNTMLGQTQQLQRTYTSVARQADAISNDAATQR